MDSLPSEYYIWDPPEEQRPVRPCNRCISYIAVYRRCRMSFRTDCTGSDPLNRAAPCGLNATSSGRPKLCEGARVISRFVDAYCDKWEHLKFSFIDHMWKCSQCHQDGQWDAMCQRCGHMCDRDCTQGNLPRATQAPSHFTDVEVAFIQEQYQALLASGRASRFQNTHRTSPSSSGAAYLSSSQRPVPPSSGLADQVPGFHAREQNPWFTGATGQVPGVQGRGAGPSSSGAAHQAAATRERGAGPSRSSAVHQVLGTQGRGVGPSPSADSLQGTAPSSSDAANQPQGTFRRAASTPSRGRSKTPSPRKRSLSRGELRQVKQASPSKSMDNARAAKISKP